MTPEQLEALIDLSEAQATEAAYYACNEGSYNSQAIRCALSRVYSAFGIQPPPYRGLVIERNRNERQV